MKTWLLIHQSSGESLGRCEYATIEEAIQYFAERKRLEEWALLQIYEVIENPPSKPKKPHKISG